MPRGSRGGGAEAHRSPACQQALAWQAATQPMRFDLLNVQIFSPPSPGRRLTVARSSPLIILGVILLIIGFIAKIAIVWTIGIVVVVAGLILMLLGMAGHAVGGRRHYY